MDKPTTSFQIPKSPKFTSAKLAKFRFAWKQFIKLHEFKDDYTKIYAIAVMSLISEGFELMIVDEIEDIMEMKNLNWMNPDKHQFWTDFAYEGKRFRLKCTCEIAGHRTFTLNKSTGEGFEWKLIGTAVTENIKTIEPEKFVLRLLEACAQDIFLADDDEDDNLTNSGRTV